MSLSLIPKSLAAVFCVLVALVSWRFMVLGVETGMAHMLYQAQQIPLAFYAHVGLAPVALFLVPFQFWTRLRNRRPDIHRWIGRLYALSILVSGVGGLVLAINTQAGLIAGLGFGVLAVFWLSTTSRGIWLARERRISEHRIWMIRSAALTFAAVTLRIQLPLSQIAGIPFDTAYTIIAWSCWVPNILAVEFWLKWKRHSPVAA